MRDFAHFIQNYLAVLKSAGVHSRRDYDYVNRSPSVASVLENQKHTILLFSPHPDDECITGALALRLKQQSGFRILNVAVTLGSNPLRAAQRASELENACTLMGFDLEMCGFVGVTIDDRLSNPDTWNVMVNRIAAIIMREKPSIIVMPHADDWHATHCGTHRLVVDALARCDNFSCSIIETEYWRQMSNPNLFVEVHPDDAIQLISGIACHRGEVERNAYHISLPAWMHDNVRRGSELIYGKEQNSCDFVFGVLYRLSRFQSGTFIDCLEKKVLRSCDQPWPI